MDISVLVENRMVFLDKGARRCEISPPTTVRKKLREHWLCKWSFNSPPREARKEPAAQRGQARRWVSAGGRCGGGRRAVSARESCTQAGQRGSRGEAAGHRPQSHSFKKQ